VLLSELLSRYKKNPYLTCVTATGNGGVVVGSKSGELRLFNDVGKRAKTSLPGLGHTIKGIDTTEDGQWILATSSKYLLVAPTSLPDGRTGFDVSMGKNKVCFLWMEFLLTIFLACPIQT
jgi:hypothetical protein